MIYVDQSNCIKCNQCIEICPAAVLESQGGYPHFNEKKNCFHCSHCVAICPENALSCHTTPQNRVPAEKDFRNEAFNEQLAMLVKARRSIRCYQKTPVPKSVVQEVLDVAKMTPSAKNQQPTNWVVVSGKEKTDHLMDLVLDWTKENNASPEIKAEYDAGNNVVTLDAPSLLISYGSKKTISPQIDCIIALTTAELLLQAKGIGTCHCGYLRRISNASAEITKYLGIPEGYEIFGILAMGYADNEEYLTLPERNTPEVNWV